MQNSKSFLRALGAGVLMLFALQAAAQDRVAPFVKERKTDVWINAGLLSYHLNRSKNYREFNYGLGAEAVVSPNHAFMAGTYMNSESQQSNYLGYQYRPFHWQPGGWDVSAGVAVSLIDGYPSMSNKGWFIAPFPIVAVEGKRLGANFMLIPNFKHGGAFAMQLKLKVW